MKYGTRGENTAALQNLVLMQLPAQMCVIFAVFPHRIWRRLREKIFVPPQSPFTSAGMVAAHRNNNFRLNCMCNRLLELNPLPRAAAWLSEHGSDHEGYQPEDILEAARESKLELLAVVPEWHSAGKISWRLRDAMPIDEEKNADANALPPGADLIDHDGLFLVSSKIAKRLLDHGECSLDCVEMPLVVCSNSAHTPPIQWLQGIDDGRLIKIHHVRVSRGVLLEFAHSPANPEATLAQREQQVGVSKTAILAAPWPYLPNCDEAQLRRLLADPPKWLIDTKARVQKGAPGRDVAIWNPAKLALALHGTKRFSRHKLTPVIKKHFPDFINEWDRYQEILLPA